MLVPISAQSSSHKITVVPLVRKITSHFLGGLRLDGCCLSSAVTPYEQSDQKCAKDANGGGVDHEPVEGNDQQTPAEIERNHERREVRHADYKWPGQSPVNTNEPYHRNLCPFKMIVSPATIRCFCLTDKCTCPGISTTTVLPNRIRPIRCPFPSLSPAYTQTFNRLAI